MADNEKLPARKETFGDRLLRAIEAKDGPTAREPASKWLLDKYGIEVSGPQITKYKNKDELPRMEQGRAYALALDVTLEWLYTGRPPMKPMEPLSDEEEELVRLVREVPPERRSRVLRQLNGYLSVQLGPGPTLVTPRSLAASAATRNKKRKR